MGDPILRVSHRSTFIWAATLVPALATPPFNLQTRHCDVLNEATISYILLATGITSISTTSLIYHRFRREQKIDIEKKGTFCFSKPENKWGHLAFTSLTFNSWNFLEWKKKKSIYIYPHMSHIKFIGFKCQFGLVRVTDFFTDILVVWVKCFFLAEHTRARIHRSGTTS